MDLWIDVASYGMMIAKHLNESKQQEENNISIELQYRINMHLDVTL